MQSNENGDTISSPYSINVIATEDAFGKVGSQSFSVALTPFTSLTLTPSDIEDVRYRVGNSEEVMTIPSYTSNY